jgi:hypothetical protein
LATERCSSTSRTSDEPLVATASVVRGWVLIEQSGAWGADAVTQSRLPAPVARELVERAERHGLRVLLLRRPDGRDGTTHNIFLAWSGRRSQWIEHRSVSEVEELLEFDLAPLAEGGRVGFGELRGRPLYLICTNGRHDPCCAQLGRPVARALLRDGDDSVWECSHVGGDRFAGNLVCLPHGLYFGRLGPGEARRVVDRYERGGVELDHYRGRAGEPFVVQAAEYFLRREHGIVGVDDLVASGVRRSSPHVAEVRFNGRHGRRFEVRVGVGTVDSPRPLTCGATSEETPPVYALLGVRSN